MSRRLRTMANMMNLGVLLIGDDLELEYANDPAQELLGCRSQQDLAACWGELKALLSEAIQAGPEGAEAGFHLDADLARPDKPRRLRLELDPIPDGEGGGYLVLLQDRELIDAVETDLRLAARHRSMARLYRAMAHDLKAPLNALAINLDLLKTILGKNPPADPILAERQGRYVRVLSDELARLNRSLQNMLTQSMPPTESDQPFELRDLVLDLTSLIAPQAKHQQVAMEVQLDEAPMTIEGQRDLLKQALLNIAVNALEAMPEGGRLNITLESRQGQAMISLQDSGPGIPADLAEKIWEMHFTTKSSGTGIGLYVARSIIESFGGAVSAEGRPGHGTSFVVSLPISLKEA